MCVGMVPREQFDRLTTAPASAENFGLEYVVPWYRRSVGSRAQDCYGETYERTRPANPNLLGRDMRAFKTH